MFDKLNQFLQDIHLTFLNFLRLSTILIIPALSIASGYTTFNGMRYYINAWIALIITVSVQIIIVVAAYELSTTYFRAHKLRFIGMAFSFIIGFTVSTHFSYIMFYNKSQAFEERTRKFKQIDSVINNYIVDVKKSQGIKLNNLSKEIKLLDNLRLRAELGTLSNVPIKFQVPGVGPVTKAYLKQIQAKKNELKSVEVGFSSFIKETDSFLVHFSLGINQDEIKYNAMRDSFIRLANHAEKIILGEDIVAKPTIPLWEDFSKSNPPHAFLTDLSLYLAFIIDILAFIFSMRLKILPTGKLTDEDIDIFYQVMPEFRDVGLNSHDQLQIGIERTREEIKAGIIDIDRKYAIASMLNKGYMRRVGKAYVEFTQKLYDIVAKKNRN